METLEKILELRKNTHVPEYYIALAYAAVGEDDRAFEWLEEAYKSRDEGLLYAPVDPSWDRLRDDPRLIAMMARVGLAL